MPRCAQSVETRVRDHFSFLLHLFFLLIQTLSIIKIFFFFFHDIRGEKQKPQKEMPLKHECSACSAAVAGLGKQLALSGAPQPSGSPRLVPGAGCGAALACLASG